MLIKICGITNEDDALAAVNAGADALGFVLWPHSKRFVTVEATARITELMPRHVQRVAVLVNPSREEVERLLAAGAFDTLQLHGEETPEFCAQWKGRAKVWKGVRVADAASLAPLAGYSVVDAVLLDSYSPASHGGTGKTFDWSLVREAKKLGRPVILSGGLTPANIREAVAAARPDGVDVSSGVELSPGKKDHKRVREFIRNAKTEITT
jgi:phosphoribosylanthranilate isomerase